MCFLCPLPKSRVEEEEEECFAPLRPPGRLQVAYPSTYKKTLRSINRSAISAKHLEENNVICMQSHLSNASVHETHSKTFSKTLALGTSYPYRKAQMCLFKDKKDDEKSEIDEGDI